MGQVAGYLGYCSATFIDSSKYSRLVIRRGRQGLHLLAANDFIPHHNDHDSTRHSKNSNPEAFQICSQ